MSTQRAASPASGTPIRFPSQGESLYLDVPPQLLTRFLNGRLQITNSDSSFVYIFRGGPTASNINIDLPPLTDDDSLATVNYSNVWNGLQQLEGGAVISGLTLDQGSDASIADGVNIGLGSDTGTQIGSGPNQMLAFFGATPVSQPIPANSSPNITDCWNALAKLGLLNAVVSGGGGGGPTSGTIPTGASGVGGRFGTYMPAGSTSLTVGNGLLTTMSSISGTASTTFINNRAAQAWTSTAGTHNNAGIRTTNPICTMTNDPIVKFKVTMNTNTNTQLALGFVSGTGATGSSFNVYLSGGSYHGCMIGFGDGDTSYSVISAAGSTQTNNTGLASLQTAGTPAIFTLQYNHTTPSVTWTIQTGPSTTVTNTITTGNLPSNTSQMYLYINSLTGGTSATSVLTIEDVEIMLSDYNVF